MLPENNYEIEEAPMELQRMWNLARARSAGNTCIPDVPDTLETFEPALEEVSETPAKKQVVDPESDYEDTVPELELEENLINRSRLQKWRKQEPLVLDASTLGDLPAVYKICPLLPHQFPVVGVYIDPRVNVGFRYKVRPLEGIKEAACTTRKPKCLFGGKALTLQSIGRGYAKRFTFDSEGSSLNNNENFFWSDSRPEGYAFEIEVIAVGDKFTLFDSDNEAQGTLEVVQLQKDQTELEQTILSDGSLEKRVKVYMLCKIEWYEKSGETPLVPVSGIAVVKKKKNESKASIMKVLNVTIGPKSIKKGFELKPGVESSLRRTIVIGENIGDIPAKYTIVGLEHYEFPVIGTFVDPRIIAGFHYRVRMVGQKRHFFQGRSLLLQSIGMGYGKRLTFTPDTLNNPENYFWSDSHPNGFGLEPRAVHSGMRFEIIANGEHLGEASVFRADMPQVEEKTELVKLSNNPKLKKAVDKHIHIDVTCHVTLATTGGGSVDSEVHLMRVSGVALVRKNPDCSKAHLVKVYNVGLDSQLNQLFVQNQTELTFHPLP